MFEKAIDLFFGGAESHKTYGESFCLSVSQKAEKTRTPRKFGREVDVAPRDRCELTDYSSDTSYFATNDFTSARQSQSCWRFFSVLSGPEYERLSTHADRLRARGGCEYRAGQMIRVQQQQQQLHMATVYIRIYVSAYGSYLYTYVCTRVWKKKPTKTVSMPEINDSSRARLRH